MLALHGASRGHSSPAHEPTPSEAAPLGFLEAIAEQGRRGDVALWASLGSQRFASVSLHLRAALPL